MKIGVIADDLTGANATGVSLNKQGFSVATIVHADQIPNTHHLDAVCIDTDSRYASDQTIKQRVSAAMEKFKIWDAKVICKRIDSTLRGNIGLEIDTVLDYRGTNSVAVVVASFPDSERISSGGYLLVEEIPVQQTDVAKDPITPLTESFIPSIIQKQSKHKVIHIGLDKVLERGKSLREEFDTNIKNGYRIIVIDAVTNEDIEHIAETMARTEQLDVIPVDPGPLTAAYSKAKLNQQMKPGKIIVTVGSLTSLTKRQLEYLKTKTNSTPVYVSAEKLASFTSSWDQEVERAVKETEHRIKKDNVLILTTHSLDAQPVNLHEVAKKEHTTKDALAKRITDGLAKITRLVIEYSNYPIQGCFTSGGDVTASLCAVTMASGIKLYDEVLPLTAYGKLMDGDFPDLPIVTKGGMVGDQRAIYESVKFLRTKVQMPYK